MAIADALSNGGHLIEGLPLLDTTATDLESLTVLWTLVQYLQPEIVVEAGTYKGHFAIPIARMLAVRGHVYTADPVRVDLPDLPNLTYVQDDFDVMLAQRPDIKGRVDFAFIDSGPPVPTAEVNVRYRHWTTCKDWLRPGGIMACHDTNTASQWGRGLDIVGEGHLRLIGGRGLVLWQKR